MKKHKRVRRRMKPVAYAPPAKGLSRGEGTDWLGWVAGFLVIAVIVVLYYAFGRHNFSSRSEAPPPLSTNNGGSAISPGAGRPDAGLGGDGKPVTRQEGENRADELNNHGTKLLETGNFPQAVEVFKQAVALQPQDETFHFNLGVALAKSGELTNAETQYKEALRLLPDYPEAHNNYGNLLARLGRMPEAEEQLTEAVKEMPDSGPFNNSLGVLSQRLSKTNEALASFQKAVACDTNYIEARFNLAEAYLARKDRDKAITELQAALKIRPDFQPAQRALAKITSTP